MPEANDLAAVRAAVLAFRDARDWRVYASEYEQASRRNEHVVRCS